MRSDIEEIYLAETEYKLRPHELQSLGEVVKPQEQIELRVAIAELLPPMQLVSLAHLRERLCA